MDVAAIQRLRQEIETEVGRTISRPRDFDYLRKRIYVRTHTFIGLTTLKRIWEYIEQGEFRVSTLEILTRFLGYDSWDAFVEGRRTGAGSDFIAGRCLRSDQDLSIGDRLTFIWEPGRRCRAEYCGDNRFTVIESENTRLLAGDTFECAMWVDGQPLYIDRLTQNGVTHHGYICGCRSGITILTPETGQDFIQTQLFSK